MLVQKLPDEFEQTLAYFSRALNDSEKRYSAFDLELLAIFAATVPSTLYACARAHGFHI